MYDTKLMDDGYQHLIISSGTKSQLSGIYGMIDHFDVLQHHQHWIWRLEHLYGYAAQPAGQELRRWSIPLYETGDIVLPPRPPRHLYLPIDLSRIRSLELSEIQSKYAYLASNVNMKARRVLTYR